MKNLKGMFLSKIERKDNKKTIENLVVFVIILIATIIFINYIWNGDKKDIENKQEATNLPETNISDIDDDIIEDIRDDNSLEKQLENILKNLDGVQDVQVLITYEETSKVIPMYNEDNQQSTTQEEDNQGRSENNK